MPTRPTPPALPAPPAPETGFSLVEVMLVVVVLAILAAVILPGAHGFLGGTRQAALATELKRMRTDLEIYEIRNGELPAATQTRASRGGPTGRRHPPTDDASALLPIKVPTNPVNDLSTVALFASMPAAPTGRTGWIYVPGTGELRANSLGEADGTRDFDL